jgi:hypothetical protein
VNGEQVKYQITQIKIISSGYVFFFAVLWVCSMYLLTNVWLVDLKYLIFFLNKNMSLNVKSEHLKLPQIIMKVMHHA